MPDSIDSRGEGPSVSRRAVIKAGAGLGLLAALKAAVGGQTPIKDALHYVADNTHDTSPTATPPQASQIDEQPTATQPIIERHNDGPHADQLPPTEDPFIASIEEKRDTRIISERKQGQEIKKAYPNLDQAYIDALPEHLDHERAGLLDAIWNTLPESFYSPYSAGNPLVAAIADFGTHTSIVGETEVDNPYRNIIALTSRQFTVENKANAASIAVHEMMHFKQHKRGELFLQKQIPEIFDKSLPELFDYTLTRLDDSSVQAACSQDFLFDLRYGVQDLLRKNETRTDTTEYDAVFSQFYYNGKDYFMTNVGAVYGQEKALALYEFLRDDLYEGKEYEHNPFAQVNELPQPAPKTPVVTPGSSDQASATEVPKGSPTSQIQSVTTEPSIVAVQTKTPAVATLDNGTAANQPPIVPRKDTREGTTPDTQISQKIVPVAGSTYADGVKSSSDGQGQPISNTPDQTIYPPGVSTEDATQSDNSN